MFGSGAKTIGTITISERRRMDRRGLSRMIIVLSLVSVCAAVLGAATTLMAAVPLSVSTTSAATTATSISVFGLSATISRVISYQQINRSKNMLQNIATYRLNFLKMSELRKLASEYGLPKQRWNRSILIVKLSKIVDWTTLPKPNIVIDYFS